MTAYTVDPAVQAEHAQLLHDLQEDSTNEVLVSKLASHIADDTPELAAALAEVFTPPPALDAHKSSKATSQPIHTDAISISNFGFTGIQKAAAAILHPKPEWKNWIGDQVAHPESIQHPKSLEDLVKAVKGALANGTTARVVGSGHSFSDVAMTDGILLKPQHLNKVLPLDISLLRSGVDAGTLFAVESGIMLKDLNAALDSRKLALVQMGAYDGQTLAGAISTGTHGTGLGLGPMASMVRAVTLVDSAGDVYQIEPAGAVRLTDPAKFSAKAATVSRADAPKVVLKQDDDWFHTVTVGMGCVGLIYSYIIEVRPAYLLEEDRTATTWEKLKDQLATTTPGENFAKIIHDNRHFEIDVNPYAFGGVHMAIMALKNESQGPAVADGEGRGFWNWVGGKLAGWDLIQSKLSTLLNAIPFLSPALINKAMDTLVNLDYIDKSFRVMNVGIGDVEAMALELSIPEDGWIQAVDRMLTIFSEEAKTKDMFLAGPIALRFVAPSDAYLAPQYGRYTIMAEMTMLYGVKSGRDLVKTVKKKMCTPGSGIRVHWGLDIDTVTANEARDMYPQFAKWEAVYRQLNANGVFNSRFTERLGLSDKK